MNHALAFNLKQSRHLLDVGLFLKLALALIIYYFFSEFVFDAVLLDEAAYHQPMLALEALKDRGFVFILVGYAFLLALNCVNLQRNPFRGRWSWQQYEADEGIKVRYIVFALVLILAWAFSTYEFNFYYDQGHYLDRLLLVILACLVFVNPIFASIFAVFAVLVVSQFNYPEFLNYSWFDKELLFKILLLFSVFNILSLFVKFRPSHFIFLSLCLIGSEYFFAGMSKLAVGNRIVGWMLDNQVHNLFVSSYINGWLTFIDRPTLLQIAGVMGIFDIPLQIFTLIFELGGILLVLGRRVSIVMLGGAVLLHLGIFLSSGIFFWKWVLLDLSLITLFWKYKHEVDSYLFTRKNAVLSLFVILAAFAFLPQTNAGWFDTRVNNFYEFEAVGANGTVRPLARGFWAPYDIPFAQVNFFYLNDDEVIVRTYGTHREFAVADVINRAESVTEIDAVWEQYAASRYSEPVASMFDDFVRTFVANANAHPGGAPPFFLRARHHITTFAPDNAYNFQFPIMRVRVRYIETFYSGEEIFILEDKIIRDIEIS